MSHTEPTDTGHLEALAAIPAVAQLAKAYIAASDRINWEWGVPPVDDDELSLAWQAALAGHNTGDDQ